MTQKKKKNFLNKLLISNKDLFLVDLEYVRIFKYQDAIIICGNLWFQMNLKFKIELMDFE